jgi:hypothetical protein
MKVDKEKFSEARCCVSELEVRPKTPVKGLEATKSYLGLTEKEP